MSLVCALWQPHAAAQTATGEAVKNSGLDAPLFYQLLIGEMELAGGNATSAYEVLMDAARRTKDEGLFRRAVEIALAARSGDRALAAARAWRMARPESLEAVRLQVQVLTAMNRAADLPEPLRQLLTLTPEADRAGALAALPRFLQRMPDRAQALGVVEQTVQPYLAATATRVPAAVALGRANLSAGRPAMALELAQRAHAQEPNAVGPVLLALELLATLPEAEAMVQTYLQQPGSEPEVRLAYARALTAQQRHGQAVEQLQTLTKVRPKLASAWLSLGALELELRHPQQAEAALRTFLDLAVQQGPTKPAVEGDEPADPDAGDQALTQAWLMLAQAAEMRGAYAEAEQWLSRVQGNSRALDVLTRRANLLARQGQLEQARALIRSAPEAEPDDARAKLMAEAQLLREARKWDEAYKLLGSAAERFPQDVDLVYEQAMMAEKMGDMARMEALLRQVMASKPDHAHAFNALGYSLAERNLRLPEARELIQKALALKPKDPFITDSLGWVEYRMGNRAEALRLLREAYQARPDVEIAAHLGEVLWAQGARDEARRVWREARIRDAANDVLRDTLARLKVDL